MEQSDMGQGQETTRPTPPKVERTSNPFLIPGAIVIAGLMIAGAVFYNSMQAPKGDLPSPGNQQATGGAPDIRPVSADDHILGNPDATVVIVEYSDFECPFCGQFHNTMHQIVDEFGKTGDVAWVYRNFPIEQLHSQAWTEAIAAECVAELGGNDAFWTFADSIFANNNGGNDGLDLSTLPDLAVAAGVDRGQFETCLASEQTRPLVQEDYDEATTGAQGNGTPHNVIIAAGQTVALPGAQPYQAMRAIVQSVIEQTSGAQ